MADKEVVDIIANTKRVVGERTDLDMLWEEMAEVLAPDRRGFTGAPLNARRTEKIFDTTPLIAKRGLTNAIGSMLRPKTSAPGKWFDMITEDEQMMEDREIKGWIEHAEGNLWSALYNPKAHFVQATGEVDSDIVTFGTGNVFCGKRSDKRGLLFRAFHMKSVYVELSSDGEVDTYYILEILTARQALQRWPVSSGAKVGAKVMEAFNEEGGKKKDDKFKFIWCVSPRYERDPRREDNLHMPWLSKVVSVDSESLVIEEGFEENPMATPRWDTRSNEVYGRGPGILALPDVLTLNQMGKTMLRALHRAVSPPWLLPSDSMVNAPQNRPEGVSYYDAKAIRNLGLRNPFMQMDSKANLPWGLDAQTAMREQVYALFYRNILNLPIAGPEMTATEVIQRREEFVREIGAVFGTLESDYTGPMVERAFNIMLRTPGAFLPPPERLLNSKVNFRFSSPVEKAKRQIEEALIGQGISKIMEIEAVHPEVGDATNWQELGKYLTESHEFPNELINPKDAMDSLSEQRNQAMQKEQEMAEAERVVGATATIAGAAGDLGAAGVMGGQ